HGCVGTNAKIHSACFTCIGDDTFYATVGVRLQVFGWETIAYLPRQQDVIPSRWQPGTSSFESIRLKEQLGIEQIGINTYVKIRVGDPGQIGHWQASWIDSRHKSTVKNGTSACCGPEVITGVVAEGRHDKGIIPNKPVI